MSNSVREKTFSSPVNINNVRAEATSTEDPHNSSQPGVCARGSMSLGMLVERVAPRRHHPAGSTVGSALVSYHLSHSGGHLFPFLIIQLVVNPINTLNVLIIEENSMALGLMKDIST